MNNKLNTVEKTIECIKKYDPDKIIIFGSYVRGEIDEYSDLDIIIIKKTESRFIERLIDVTKLIDYSLGKIDLFVYTPAEFQKMIELENPFINNVLKEGKVIYEKK